MVVEIFHHSKDGRGHTHHVTDYSQPRHMATVDRMDHFIGERMSIADVAVAACGGRLKRRGAPEPLVNDSPDMQLIDGTCISHEHDEGGEGYKVCLGWWPRSAAPPYGSK